MTTFDLERTYLAVDRGEVIELPVGPDFWEKVGASPAATRSLVGVYPNAADWPHWEMHPEGAEVLVLLEGRIDLLLDDGKGERVAHMEEGTTVVVPSGVWHRAQVREPGRLLVITWGRGTQHRPA